MSENDSAMDVTKQDVSSPLGGGKMPEEHKVLIGLIIATIIIVGLLLIL